MSELTRSYELAGKVLERVNADPDDDLAVLSRQLLRHKERDEIQRATIQQLQERVQELERLISDTPRCQTFVQSDFQRLWEACNKLVEKAEFKFVFRYVEKLEAKLAEREAEVARLKEELATWDEFKQRDVYQALVDARAKIARLNAELHDVNVQCGKNAASHMHEYYRAEEWKVEARWAADEVMTLMKSRAPAHILAQDPVYQRAQRILEG